MEAGAEAGLHELVAVVPPGGAEVVLRYRQLVGRWGGQDQLQLPAAPAPAARADLHLVLEEFGLANFSCSGCPPSTAVNTWNSTSTGTTHPYISFYFGMP